MKIDRENLLKLESKEAAADLLAAGESLRGKNLKKASWVEIAEALHTIRLQENLLGRLAAATTREDAVRILRIARKWSRQRHGSPGGGAHRTPRQPLKAAAPELIQENQAFAEYVRDEEFFQRELIEYDWADPEDVQEYMNGGPGEGKSCRVEGLMPITAVQEEIFQYAWQRRPKRAALPEDIRSRLDDEAYQKLLCAARDRTGIHLTAEEDEYLRSHNLTELLEFAAYPEQKGCARLANGFQAAGLDIIEAHVESQHPFEFDWPALQDWLVEKLGQAPHSEVVRPVLAAFYRACQDLPAAELKALLGMFSDFHAAWLPLVLFSLPRLDELLPMPPHKKPYHGWEYRTNLSSRAWESLLEAGLGSRLALYNLASNLQDLYSSQELPADVYWMGARSLLAVGGGSLGRMDYPSFTLTCRRRLSDIPLELFARLVGLASALEAYHKVLAQIDRESLAGLLRQSYQSLTSAELPVETAQGVAAELEQHTIAYLMLKERVLAESFRQAPFRLRRKHIRHFWHSWAADELGELRVPLTLEALRGEFSVEQIKEGLAHALLDRFKGEMPAAGGQPEALKESLILTLRSIAIVYQYVPTWLPPKPEVWPADLEHASEVADFLVRQLEHSPLELAQVLQLDAQAGLPHLNGGQTSFLERHYRQLLREAVGAANKPQPGSEHVSGARIYTCQPISKVEALNRGHLGGDCSSRSVPLRALSPHHVYYGIFENGVRQRGYMTVFEAWAEPENGARVPSLCLETINMPDRQFDSNLQDILLIFESIALSRGLSPRLVLITSIGTWNYQSGEMLRQCRRFRQGEPVKLHPADPVSWNVYRLATLEGGAYSSFQMDAAGQYARSAPFRQLAGWDESLERFEPENLEEARRIAALASRRLIVTARTAGGRPAGFISSWPAVRDAH